MRSLPGNLATRIVLVALTVGLVIAAGSQPALADPVIDADSDDVRDGLVIVGQEANEGSDTPGQTTPTTSPYVSYRWSSLCSTGPTTTIDLECTASLTCDTPDLRRWQLWGQLANGNWVTIRTQCFGATPPEVESPTVTQGDVISALRRIGLPHLVTKVQPDSKTLVNFDTIFYTDPEPVSLNLTILGQAVDVQATPSQYLWVFDDGTSATTTTPGAAYPAKTIVHRYADARVTVHPHVEVTYTAQFRVNGGAWQNIDETVTTVGPDATLRVAEATPLLSGEHR